MTATRSPSSPRVRRSPCASPATSAVTPGPVKPCPPPYLAHGKATPTSIEASFGDLGRISLRLRPSGRELHATRRAGCKRPHGLPIARIGLFVGELRFRGEDGYNSARAPRGHRGSS